MSDDSNRADDANTTGAGSDASGANAVNNSGDALRPSGKRQFAGQATTSRAMSATYKPEVVETRKNPFTAMMDYLAGVVKEMRKVIWPTSSELVNYSVIVIVFLVLTTALVAGVDWLTSQGVRWVFGI